MNVQFQSGASSPSDSYIDLTFGLWHLTLKDRPRFKFHISDSMEPHGQVRGPHKPYPPTPLGAEALRCAGAKASVGHPPVSEIRRSMIEWSALAFPSRVTHSSTAKAVVSCVGG